MTVGMATEPARDASERPTKETIGVEWRLWETAPCGFHGIHALKSAKRDKSANGKDQNHEDG